MYNYDRSEEFEDALRQLKIIVAKEHPDVMLVCGDVYHTTTPTIGAQRIFTRSMYEICKANEAMHVVVVSGNHDSASRMDLNKELWLSQRVHVVGGLVRDEQDVPDATKHIIVLPKVCVVVAVPYFNHRITSAEKIFKTLLSEAERINEEGLPIIVMAHDAICGADTLGHDDSIGGIDFVRLDEFGDGYDYLAAGHLHRRQSVKVSGEKVRYSGSLIQVSFDEIYAHGVDIVEVERGREPKVRSVDIKPLRPLINLPRDGGKGNGMTIEDVLNELREIDDKSECYIRLNVVANRKAITNIKEKAQAIIRDKKYCLCNINIVSKEEQNDLQKRSMEMDLYELKNKSAMDIAQMIFEAHYGEKMTNEEVSLMEEVYENCREKQ